VNDGKDVGENHRVMKSIFYYVDPINVHNPKTFLKKGLITYYETYGT
jgi:hypothetical protein